MSLDGHVEFVTTRTKLLTAFPTPLSFIGTWETYKAVRTYFHPNYSSAFNDWTERLVHRATLFPWNNVLNYAVAYFQAHQRDPPSQWLLPDSDLITETIMCAPSPTALPSCITRQYTPFKSPASPSKTTRGFDSDICQKWNDSKCNDTICPAGLHHICNTCFEDTHQASQCPSITGSPSDSPSETES
jgi:hypothetical protein